MSKLTFCIQLCFVCVCAGGTVQIHQFIYNECLYLLSFLLVPFKFVFFFRLWLLYFILNCPEFWPKSKLSFTLTRKTGPCPVKWTPWALLLWFLGSWVPLSTFSLLSVFFQFYFLPSVAALVAGQHVKIASFRRKSRWGTLQDDVSKIMTKKQQEKKHLSG